jgi:hypothetical protein
MSELLKFEVNRRGRHYHPQSSGRSSTLSPTICWRIGWPAWRSAVSIRKCMSSSLRGRGALSQPAADVDGFSASASQTPAGIKNRLVNGIQRLPRKMAEY